MPYNPIKPLTDTDKRHGTNAGYIAHLKIKKKIDPNHIICDECLNAHYDMHKRYMAKYRKEDALYKKENEIVYLNRKWNKNYFDMAKQLSLQASWEYLGGIGNNEFGQKLSVKPLNDRQLDEYF